MPEPKMNKNGCTLALDKILSSGYIPRDTLAHSLSLSLSLSLSRYYYHSNGALPSKANRRALLMYTRTVLTRTDRARLHPYSIYRPAAINYTLRRTFRQRCIYVYAHLRKLKFGQKVILTSLTPWDPAEYKAVR